MNEDEQVEVRILALRKTATPVPGSESVEAACGHDVIVGPATLRAMKTSVSGKRRVRVICLPCGLMDKEVIQEAIKKNGLSVLPGVRNELLNAGVAEETITRMFDSLDIKERDLPSVETD